MAGFAWSHLARHHGATSDLVAGGHFDGFPRGDPAVWQRLRPVGTSMLSMFGLLTGLPAVSGVLGGAPLRRHRAALGLGSDLWLTYVMFLATLTVTYLTSPNDITRHLATSANRVTVPLTLLVAASRMIWGVTAYAACIRPDVLAEAPMRGAIMPTAS